MSSIFAEAESAPDDAALAEVLGRTKAHWDAVVRRAQNLCVGVAWKFYGRKHGWQLKLVHEKRALLYLIPHAKSFLAGMALGDAAVEAVRASRLPPDLVQEIVAAKRYPEGRPARVEVTSKKQADLVLRLLQLKLTQYGPPRSAT